MAGRLRAPAAASPLEPDGARQGGLPDRPDVPPGAERDPGRCCRSPAPARAREQQRAREDGRESALFLSSAAALAGAGLPPPSPSSPGLPPPSPCSSLRDKLLESQQRRRDGVAAVCIEGVELPGAVELDDGEAVWVEARGDRARRGR